MFKIILTIGTIQALAIGIQFIRSKVVAVLLGPAGVGVISTIDQVVQFAAYLTALSIPMASVKFLSRAHSEGHEEFKRCYAGFLKLLLFLSAVGAISTIGIVFLRADILGAEIVKYRLYLLLALFMLPTFTLGGFFSNVFASAQKYRASSLLAVITNATTTVAIVIGVIVAGIFGLYLGGAVAGFVLTIGTMVYLWKKLDLPLFDRNTRVLAELKHNPNIISFAMMLYFGSVTYSFSFLVARYSVLKTFGEIEAGLLQGAIALALALGMVLNPANGLYLTPIMNRNIEKAKKIRHAIEFQRKIVVILSLAALPIVLFPQLILAIMFSSKFSAVSNLVFLFIFAQVITQLAGVYQALLIGTEDLKMYTVIVTLCQLSFALMSWLLVPHFGIKGVAFGQIISSSMIFSLTFIRLKLKHAFSIPLNLSLLLGYVLFVVFLAGLLSAQRAEWDMTITLSKIGFFILFTLSLYLFLNKEEKASLYGLRNRLLCGK